MTTDAPSRREPEGQRAADAARAAGDQTATFPAREAGHAFVARRGCVARDDRLLDLVRALLEALRARVAVDALDRARRPVADAAVDLQRLVGDAGEHLDREQLRHRRTARRGVGAPRLPLARGVQHELPGGLDVGRRSRRAEGDRLARGERLAERLALAGVLDRELLRALRPVRRRSSPPRCGSGSGSRRARPPARRPSSPRRFGDRDRRAGRTRGARGRCRARPCVSAMSARRARSALSRSTMQRDGAVGCRVVPSSRANSSQ